MNTMNNSETYSDKDNIVSATWPNPLWAMNHPYHPYPSVPQNTYPGPASAPGYPSAAGTYGPDFNAADEAAFPFAPPTEMGAFTNLPTQVDSTNQNVIDPWSMPGPSFDVNWAVSQLPPLGHPYWAEIAAAFLAATTPDLGVSPTSTTPTSPSPDERVWVSNPLEFHCGIPAPFSGHGGGAGWVAPEPVANPSQVMISQAGWDTSETSWPIPAMSGHDTSNATVTYTPTATLGKRRGEAETPQDEVRPQKRARGKGILKAVRSAARARRKPAPRIPNKRLDGKPKEAGRGAERLATPNSQGIYHQSLPGPSSQQGWVVDAADGKPNWVEGSEEVVHCIDSAVQKQRDEATEPFDIPRKFQARFRLLLQASEADFARGTVQAIKCRLCPDVKFKNFEEFKRHCKTTETHPLEINFCGRCGDYFARSDSLKRHNNLPPAECVKVTLVEAEEKQRVTEEEYKAFIRRLRHGLTRGEDIGKPFSQIMKEKFPGSSKKRTGGSK